MPCTDRSSSSGILPARVAVPFAGSVDRIRIDASAEVPALTAPSSNGASVATKQQGGKRRGATNSCEPS